MCKITRNARRAVVAVRQPQTHTQVDQVKNVSHLQELKQKENNSPLETQVHYEIQAEQLVELSPHNANKKKQKNDTNSKNDSRVTVTSANEMLIVEKNNSNNKLDCSPNVNQTMHESLRAIAALCLPEVPNVTHGKIIRQCLLGQVCMGSYSLGNNESLPVVVKEFSLPQVMNKVTKSGSQLHENALLELQIHAYLQKKQVKNVIGLYAMHHSLSKNALFAYLEYASKGELFSVLQNRPTTLPLSVSANYFVQLLQGISSLHSNNVVHRDLSLENVLLTENNEVKICDFGLATICSPGTLLHEGYAIGKVKYMCPEVYYGEQYDPRSADVWSTAVIFFLLLTNVFPYESPSAEDPRLVMLCHGQINELLTHWKRPALDDEILEVFSHMFCPPQQRWSASRLLQLPFCQRYINMNAADIANAFAPHDDLHCQTDVDTTPTTTAVTPEHRQPTSADEPVPELANISIASTATGSPTPSIPQSPDYSIESTMDSTSTPKDSTHFQQEHQNQKQQAEFPLRFESNCPSASM